MNRDFVHLHNHSTYSFGDGISQIPHMAKRAKEMGMHSLALTDHGYGHGLIEFHQSCTKEGVKPILGCEIYFSTKGRLIKTDENRRSNHLVLLAKNKTGYKNLVTILSLAATEGFYYKPRADWDLLNRYSDGLICLTACLAGPVAVHMYDNGERAKKDHEKAKVVLGQLKDIFKEDLFLEVQYHGIAPRKGHALDFQSELIKSAFPLSKACDVPMIVTNDAHYVEPKQWKLRDLMMADACGQTVNDPLREIKDNEHQYYMKTVDQMWNLFGAYDPNILLNTAEVARRVEHYDPGLESGHRLPKFSGSSAQAFGNLVKSSFDILYPTATKNSDSTKRLEHELKTIETLGFRDYFLIVQDFINHAESKNISIGPGRGSAAGSIIAYCMGITTLDPMEHDLLFERFLNPSRISLPDIDVDVCKERRGEIIEYLSKKYGEDSVAQIITFNRLKGRGSIRTVGRALEVDNDTQTEINSVLPRDAGEFSVSLREVVEAKENAPKQAVQKIKSFINSSEANAEYIHSAMELEGTYKSSGIHAAAVVIGPEPLKNILPLKLAKAGSMSTQYSMDTVEDLGLLKMDLLGLDTLTVVSNALHMIMNDNPKGPLHGQDSIYTLRDLQEFIPNLEDERVYKTIFNDGRTVGIFQCDSTGLRELLARMQCGSFSDISAALALYRPGPLDCIDGQVKVLCGYEELKSGRKSYKYKTIKQLYDEWENPRSNKTRPLMRVISYDTESRKFFRNRIQAVQKGPKKQMYKIGVSTKSGYKIPLTGKQRLTEHMICSEDHKFLTSKGAYKKLKDLVPGDYIAITRKLFGSVKPTIRRGTPGRKTFKDIAFRNWEYVCCMCDWDKGSLEVNHLEGNRDTNNDSENLSYLCPNHHRMYTEGTLAKEDVIKRRESYRIPQSDDIVYARYEHKTICVEWRDSYDICVEGPHNNFVAADYIVHNSGMVDSFIKRRRGVEKETLWHEELRPYLEKTHGLPIYQEQIMFASQILCGFDMSEADNLRKVIGKKKKDAIAEFREKFVKASQKEGKVDIIHANKIYDDIELFGRYAFNLSHSASYAVITYYTGWLKTYYPDYFMSALLNKFVATEIALSDSVKKSKKNNDELFQIYLMEAQMMGVEIAPPDIATSYADFRPIGNKRISFGLGSLKGVGTAIQDLIEQRDRTGNFKTLPDFIKACIEKKINKTVAMRFVESGCIDFGIAKTELMKLIKGYPRPKKIGEGLTKTSKSIFDDVKDLQKKREKESKKFQAMTDEEKSQDIAQREDSYTEGMNALCENAKKAAEVEAKIIDPPGIYRIKRKVRVQKK